MVEENIQVAVRLKPFDDFGTGKWAIADGAVVREADPSTDVYQFDLLYDTLRDNESVYQESIVPLVEAAIGGYNTAICGYGQSGSGKTHTLSGSDEEDGIIQLMFHDLFERFSKDRIRKFMIHISYLEIYNEVVRDLLGPGDDLKVLEGRDGMPVVQHLTQHQVTNVVEVERLLRRAQEIRQVGATNLNERSSRSHTILKVQLEANDAGTGIKSRTSIINLVDLAGSENAEAAGTAGRRQQEGANINKSLLSLTRVIGLLSDKKKHTGHIPYRDSRLTRILKPSLGGNSKTLVICCIRPDSDVETHSTLKFARLVKDVKACPIVNVVTEDGQLSKCLAEIEELRRQLDEKNNTETNEQLAERQRLTELMRGIIQHTSTNQSSRAQNRRMTWAPGSRLMAPLRRSFSPPQRRVDLQPVMEDETDDIQPLAPTFEFPPFNNRASLNAVDRRQSGSTTSGRESRHSEMDSFISARVECPPEHAFISERALQLEQENDGLQNQLASCQEELASVRATLGSLEEERARFEEISSAHQLEKTKSSEYVTELESLRRDLVETRAAADGRVLEITQAHDLEKVGLHACIAELRQELEKALSDKEQLKNQNEGGVDSSERRRLVENIEQQAEKANLLSQELNDKKIALSDAQDELELVKSQKESLLADIRHRDEEKNALLAEFETKLAKSMEDGQKMTSDLRTEISALQIAIKKLQDDASLSSNEALQKQTLLTRELVSQLEQAQNTVSELREEMRGLRQKIVTELQSKVADKLRENEDHICQLTKKVADLQNQNKQLLEEHSEAAAGSADDVRRLAELKALVESQKSSLEELTAKAARVSELDKEVFYLTAEVDHWKREMRAKKDSNNLLVQRCNSIIDEHRKAVADADSAEQQLKAANLKIRQIESESSSKDAKVVDLTKRLQTSELANAANSKKIVEYEEKLRERRDEVYRCGIRLQELQTELAAIRAEQSDREEQLKQQYQHQIATLTQSLDSRDEEVVQLRGEVARAKREAADQQRLAIKTIQQMEKMQKEKAVNQNQPTTSDGGATDSSRALLESKIETLEEQLRTQKDLCSKAETRINDLLQEREKGYKYVSQLKDELKTLRKDKSDRPPLKEVADRNK